MGAFRSCLHWKTDCSSQVIRPLTLGGTWRSFRTARVGQSLWRFGSDGRSSFPERPFFFRGGLLRHPVALYSSSVRWFLSCLLILLPGLLLGAEALLPQVQRELRGRRLYFGEIDGRASAETVKAIEKLQEAKGFEKTGHLDHQTLHALGFSGSAGAPSEEVQRLGACCDTVLRYLQARQTGEWSKVRDFYAPSVNFLYDGVLDRAAIERLHAAEDKRWPSRQFTLLNRIASLLPEGRAQVTVRVRTDAAIERPAMQARTEDLIFRLKQTDGRWEITALKLLE